MKMKGFLSLCFVFAMLTCVAMPAQAKASVVGFDNDVGFTQGTAIAPNFAHEFFPMVAHTTINMHEKTLHHYERMIFHSNGTKATAPIFWEGKDSKSSRCKTILNNIKNTNGKSLASTYKFGKGNKRLSCKA
jgi:hypothetical protein